MMAESYWHLPEGVLAFLAHLPHKAEIGGGALKPVGAACGWCRDRLGEGTALDRTKPESTWGHSGPLFFFADENAAFEFRMTWG